MNKQQAADYLGVSGRAVERYTQQGKLSVHYEPGKTRPVAVYREEELRPLKSEIAANLYHQRPAVEKGNPANHEQAGDVGEVTALARGVGNADALALIIREVATATVGALRADALRAAQAPADGTPPVPLRDKMTLSFREAAHLSGVPESHLREGYARGILRGAKIGRGVRVTPDDVRKYVEQRMKGKK